MENPMQFHYHWTSWKSPIGLGFFLLTASLAAFIAFNLLTGIVGIIAMSFHNNDRGPVQVMPMEYGAPTDGGMSR